MEFKIRYSSICQMLALCKKLKSGTLTYNDVDKLLKHEDYKVEFNRYKNRVDEKEFIEYFLNFPKLLETEIENEDLRIHHSYYKDLYENLEYYIDRTKELERFTPELFENQINIALQGLPDDIKLHELNFIFTVGIGQSFGYVYESNMHFDYLQLIKNNSIDDFCATIAHEVHHVGMNLIYEDIDLNAISIEELFYLYFSGEGLAVKYCNNAEGVLSKSINKGPKNIGLDDFTWEYLNSDFNDTMRHFKETIQKIRTKEISKREELEKALESYWMNPYIEGQEEKDIPKLKQFRLYSFGNDIWGIIHDCFGKETVFRTIKDLSSFLYVFNKALEQIKRDDLKI